MAMSPQTIELLITVVRQAASVGALGVQAFARWRANSAQISQMVAEGRDPTPAEHAQLSRRLAALDDELLDSLARSEATKAAELAAEEAAEAAIAAEDVEIPPTGEE